MRDIIDSEAIIQQILSSRKYQAMGIPHETVSSLLEQEVLRHKDTRAAVHAVKQKLHTIIAPYLEEMDYGAAQLSLDQAFMDGSEEVLKAACRRIMASHVSTRERLPYLDSFYKRIFAVTGIPKIVVDLACGLDPFSLPWMPHARDIVYYAYDIVRPRCDLINHFFERQQKHSQAYIQDILVNPPQVDASAAFFFKEAHRFEERQKGCNRAFWQAIRAQWLLVSLPTHSLSGKHDLLPGQRNLVKNTLKDLPWQVEEILFTDEVVFCIKKYG